MMSIFLLLVVKGVLIIRCIIDCCPGYIYGLMHVWTKLKPTNVKR